jgi:hypothetical protein
MSVSVSTTAGTQVSVTIDGNTLLSFTTQDSSVNVLNGDTTSVSVTNQGPKGDTGATGATGADGADGQGVPTGGSQFQLLRKVSGDDYDTTWDYADRVTLEVRFDEAVSKGDPLYITGFNNGQNRITVAKADASDSSKMPSIGLAFADYSQNDNGQATSMGSLDDVNTQVSPNDFQEGDVLYVNAGGGLTNVKPTGTNLIQNVGKVGRRQQNNGEIVVMAIGRSNDVPNIPDGQIWIGNASGVATPTAFGVDLDSTPQLGGDLDVNGNKITSASNGDITIDPDGTGAIILKSDDIQFDGGGVFQGKIKLYESDITGSNFVALQAPLTLSADTTYTLPASPSSGDVLQTDGVGTLSWVERLTKSNATHEGTFNLKSLSGGSDALLAFYDDAGDNYIILRAPDVLTGNTTFVLPAADGSVNQVIKTDGSGNLSFVDQTTDTDTNLGNSDQTISADRTIELGSNNIIIENGGVEKLKIFNAGYIKSTGRVIVNGNGTTGGLVRINDADSSNYVDLQAPTTISSNVSFVLPDADGSADQVLKTDGSGNLSFADQSSDPIIPLTNISGRYQWASADDGERIFTGNTNYGPFNWYSFTSEPGQATMRVYSGTEVAGTTSVSMSSYLLIAYAIKNPYSGKKVRVDYDFRVFGSPAVTASTPFGFSVWSANAVASGGTGNTTYTYRGESSDHNVSTSSVAHYHGSFTTSAAIEDDHILVLPEHRDSSGGINGTTYMYANFAVYMVD